MIGNMGYNNEFNELKQDNLINISFIKKVQWFTIVCHEKDKVSFIIQKYRDKFNDYDLEERFVFNAKLLKPSLTVKDAGLINGSIIQIVIT